MFSFCFNSFSRPLCNVFTFSCCTATKKKSVTGDVIFTGKVWAEGYRVPSSNLYKKTEREFIEKVIDQEGLVASLRFKAIKL